MIGLAITPTTCPQLLPPLNLVIGVEYRNGICQPLLVSHLVQNPIRQITMLTVDIFGKTGAYRQN